MLMRILLVEDNRHIAQSLAEVLAQQRYTLHLDCSLRILPWLIHLASKHSIKNRIFKVLIPIKI